MYLMNKRNTRCRLRLSARTCVAAGALAALFNSCFTLCSAQTCTPPAAGLIGWWKAEGDGMDQLLVHNGTLLGSTTFGSGEVGQAFVFNGSSGCAVRVTNSAAFQVQDFTIEAWIQRSSSSVAS